MASTIGGFSLAGFAKQIVEVRGEFQKLEVAFNVLLQNKEKANALMSQMVDTAATTPFSLQDVAGGAKQLLAYGVAAENVNDTLLRLGDISAALSIPLGDLIYLYGTTMVQGRLYTRDYVQFLGRGIPLQKELAKVLETSEDKIADFVKEGKVGFNEINAAIVNLTNNGGLFGGMMKQMSTTFTGQISNIKDQISVMFNELGKDFATPINASLDFVRLLLDNYKLLIATMGGVIAMRTTEKAIIMLTSAVATAAAEKEMAMMKYLTEEKIAQKNIEGEILAAKTPQFTQQQLLLNSEKERLAAILARAKAESVAANESLANAVKVDVAAKNELLSARQLLAAKERERQALLEEGRMIELEAASRERDTLAASVNTAEIKANTAARKLESAETTAAAAAERAHTIETNINTATLTRSGKAAKGLSATIGKLGSAFMSLTGLDLLLNPIGAVIAAIGALSFSIYQYKQATKDLPDIEETIGEEMTKNGKTYNENIVLYERLRTSWNNLSDDLEERQKFLEEHRMEMSRLGVATDDAETAEQFFVNNTGNVIQSFQLRAQAAAAAALATKYYEEEMASETGSQNSGSAKWYETSWSQLKTFAGMIPAALTGKNGFNDYLKANGLVDATGHWKPGATTGKGNLKYTLQEQATKSRKLAEEFTKRQDELLRQADALFKPTGGTFSGGAGGSEGSGSGKKSSSRGTGRTPEQIANDIAKANEQWLAAIRARAEEQAKAIVEMENQLADAQVEAMRDGFAKTQAEQRREHEQNLSDIEMERRERIEEELKALQKEFDEREDYLVAQSKNAKGKPTYARKTFDFDKAFQEALAGNFAEDSYLMSIDANSAEFVQKVNSMAKQFQTYETQRFNYLVSKTLEEHLYSEQEKLNQLYQRYGSFQQKLEAFITQKDHELQRPDSTPGEIAVALAEYEGNAQGVKFDSDKLYGELMMAFEDASEFTNAAINNLIAKMENYRKTILSTLSNDQILEFNKRLTELYDLQYKRQQGNVRLSKQQAEEAKRILELRVKEIERNKEAYQTRLATLNASLNSTQTQIQAWASTQGVTGLDMSNPLGIYDQILAAKPNATPQQLDEVRVLTGTYAQLRTEANATNDVIQQSNSQIEQLKDTINQLTEGALGNFASFMKDGLKGLFDPDKIEAIENVFSRVTSEINAAAEAVDGVKGMMESLGKDTDATTAIGKASAIFNMASGAVEGATSGFAALASGNLIGAVAGAVKMVGSLVNGVSKMHDDAIQKRIEDIDDDLHLLSNAYNDIADKVEKAFSSDAANKIAEQNKNLKEQMRLIEEQKRLEEDKKNSDEDALTSYEDKLRDIRKQIEENKEAAIDAIIGEDVQASIRRFAEMYTDSLQNGKNLKKGAKEMVVNMLQGMIEEAISADVAKPMELLREKMNDYWKDKIISQYEREDLENAAAEMTEKIRQQFEWAEGIFKDEMASYNGTSNGFGTMNQESADELNGRFAALQIIAQENLIIAKESNGHLSNIENYCYNIDKQMGALLSSMGVQIEHLNKISKRM